MPNKTRHTPLDSYAPFLSLQIIDDIVNDWTIQALYGAPNSLSRQHLAQLSEQYPSARATLELHRILKEVHGFESAAVHKAHYSIVLRQLESDFPKLLLRRVKRLRKTASR